MCERNGKNDKTHLNRNVDVHLSAHAMSGTIPAAELFREVLERGVVVFAEATHGSAEPLGLPLQGHLATGQQRVPNSRRMTARAREAHAYTCIAVATHRSRHLCTHAAERGESLKVMSTSILRSMFIERTDMRRCFTRPVDRNVRLISP